MKSLSRTLALLSSLGVAAVGAIALTVGCANGTNEDDAVGYLATVPADSGVEEESPSVKASLPSPSDPDTNVDDSDAGGDGTDSGGPTGDAGGGGDAGAGDAGGGGGTTSCNATNTCMAATNLGSVSGDTGADSKSAQGYTSQWFQIDVTEDDNSIDGVELMMSATLTSPPGTNFDLFVYVPGSKGARECSSVADSSTSTGTSDSTTAHFGETGLFSNGSDDGRTVTVEVRHISGTCDPSAKWTLNIVGDQ